jgi:hypothetical protein
LLQAGIGAGREERKRKEEKKEGTEKTGKSTQKIRSEAFEPQKLTWLC